MSLVFVSSLVCVLERLEECFWYVFQVTRNMWKGLDSLLILHFFSVMKDCRMPCCPKQYKIKILFRENCISSAGIYSCLIETLPFAFVKEETMIVPITCIKGYTALFT